MLKGKVALITGAAQGLGLEMARALHEAGAALALVDNQGDLLAEEATAFDHGPEVATFVGDITDFATTAALPSRIHEQFGRLDILVNNAGIRSVHPFIDLPLETWKRTLEVNLTAPFVLAQAVAPIMIAGGGGRIVNVTSVAAELAFKNRSDYNVSKAGLAMLTQSIALELGTQGVRCNAVAPGVVETPLNSNYFLDRDVTKVIIDNTPVGRWGQPSDLAGAVLFLCSDEADFINGTVITVDGGWSAGKGY